MSDSHTAAATADLIDSEIKRYARPLRSAGLKFAAAVERGFEADTRLGRAQELRVTVSLAMGFYYLTAIIDRVLVPDIGRVGLLIRLLDLPVLLGLLVLGPKLHGRIREALAAFAALVAIVSLALLPALSAAPLAPFAIATSWIALIYANTTFPLRFRSACVCSGVGCGTMIAEVFTQPAFSIELGWALTIQIVTAGSFSLITSYRIERQVRHNYLLAAREALRLQEISADRATLTVLSNTDSLTGLANRGCFDRQSAALLADPAKVGTAVALLMLDVDHFKRYNDYYGHPDGDACLRTLAAALADTLTGINGFAARYGGEEFVVLLAACDRAEAKAIAEALCGGIAALRLPHVSRNDGTPIVTISVGVACAVVGDGTTVDELIATADQRLYTAKKQGRNRVEARLSLAAA